MNDKKTLGEAIFVDIESNAYLNELHENILFNYALKLFQIQGGQKEYNLKDALRFADLLSKSTHPTNSDSHKMWAQELVILIYKVYDEFMTVYQRLIPALAIQYCKDNSFDYEHEGSTTSSFDSVKQFYLDAYEALGNLLIIPVALNNIKYATALDYDRTAKTTKQFFAKVQNKMHYAVHGHTAAELIYERADADKPHMGLTTWAAAPEGKIVKSDVSIAKNYLSEKEMRSLERIVSAYLDLAEDRAERHIPMTMEDWAKRLDLFLMADDREVLQDAGKITAEIAKAKAETEFEKYRVIQDRLFMSDFDKYMLELEENAKK